MWHDREHPGLIDATRAFVFCPTLIDWFAHFMAAVSPPFFVVEVAQAFQFFSQESTVLLNRGFLRAPALANNIFIVADRYLQCI